MKTILALLAFSQFAIAQTANTLVHTDQGGSAFHIDAGATFDIGGADATQVAFQKTCTITSAAASTAVHCLPASSVGSAQKAYLTSWYGKVAGSTAWGTVSNCTIQDSAGSNKFVQINAAGMAAQSVITERMNPTPTLYDSYTQGQGGNTATGIDVVCNATGTGSDFVLTVSGIVK